jgi:hypothetical protein
MKRGQAIKVNGEWLAVIDNLETGERYSIHCADEVQAESIVVRETLLA